jgi:hypothetical protein
LSRRSLGFLAALVVSGAAMVFGASPAGAAGPPLLGDSWAAAVATDSARLQAEVDPNGFATGYHFDYITEAAHDANVKAGKDGFTGALRSPSVFDESIGAGSGFLTVLRLLFSLQPDTTYLYRVVATNTAPGAATGPTQRFVTQPNPGGSLLPDGRAWEMVSPVDKNGGQVEPPGAIAGGGLLQAAAGGGAVTYGSLASFAAGSVGAPPGSQYVATRTSGGWSTRGIDVPIFSGSYRTDGEGAPYRLFSDDLAHGLLLNGDPCRGEGSGCPVANPPLPGTDAPAGYQNYYLRDSAGPSFEALLGSDEIAGLGLDPAGFELAFAGASPDLRHVALSSCAALTADAADGCGSGKANLYLWSSAAGLELVNEAPGASLAAQSGAISSDGERVYWVDEATGDLHLREGGSSEQVDADAGGGGTFETASADGSVAFFAKGGHLWRYRVSTDESEDITPGGGVQGVLGASANGSHTYYLDGAGLQLWRDGLSVVEVAPGADAADPVTYPPATGASRVSADGGELLFVSTASLTGFDNTDLNTKAADSQVYVYDAVADSLTCVSCNPTNGRPIGPSTIPGAVANGTGPGATVSYKPRVLSTGASRVFFDSRDALVSADTNSDDDVYQWEAQGTGSCTRPGGCVALISSGKAVEGAAFADASADGSDAFFLTDGSLVGFDPGSVDLYDARIGGGFPEPSTPIPCNGDACQALPADPGDPTLTTLLQGLGNPPVRYRKPARCRAGTRKRGGKCVKRAGGKKRRAGARRGGRR